MRTISSLFSPITCRAREASAVLHLRLWPLHPMCCCSRHAARSGLGTPCSPLLKLASTQQGCHAQTAQRNSVAPSTRTHQGVGEAAVGRVVLLNELALAVGGGLQQFPDQACSRGEPERLRQSVHNGGCTGAQQPVVLHPRAARIRGAATAAASFLAGRCSRHPPGSSRSTSCMLRCRLLPRRGFKRHLHDRGRDAAWVSCGGPQKRQQPACCQACWRTSAHQQSCQACGGKRCAEPGWPSKA